MGNEATVRAKVDGRADHGHALLETHEVLFRGARRCVVKLDAPTRKQARAQGGWLSLGPLELELGPVKAARWLAKIQKPKSVLEKLGVKAGQKVRLVGMGDATLAAQLEEVGALITSGPADVVFFEVHQRKDLSRLPRVTGDGVLWLLRPKGKDSPVSERDTMAAGKAHGLVDVKVVGFSPTLSAEKYVVPLDRRK